MTERFTVFEHGSLIEGQMYEGILFTSGHHLLLEKFFRPENFPYYSLIRKGVRFCEYVGVIQIGHLVIEVLPKADRDGDGDKKYWRDKLIDMLRTVNSFDIEAPSSAMLKIKPHSILDLYIALFIKETEQLFHSGLIKKYRKIVANSTALKGSLHLPRHLQKNALHKERFYVRYTAYDKDNTLNRILYKTLHFLNEHPSATYLKSPIASLLIQFPELTDIKVTESVFSQISYTRKTEPYRKAIQIARMLLLNYYPDLSNGSNNALALMFDMNNLWEQFIYVSLKRNSRPGYSVHGQSRKHFWKNVHGHRVRMIPDLLITKDNLEFAVLDTKWKNIGDENPKPDDLRQMYAYSKFHGNALTALVYPGKQNGFKKGYFLDEAGDENIESSTCGVMTLKVGDNVREWGRNIADEIFYYLENTKI